MGHLSRVVSSLIDKLRFPAHAAIDHPADGGITGEDYPEDNPDHKQ